VLNQNYPNFEHIIIDGGSTDGTVEILKKYLHLKWITEPDEGQSDALNKGFKMAEGDYVGWLNADDAYLPNTFNKIIDAFEKNHEADIVYGEIYFTDENFNIIRRKYDHPFDKKILLYLGCVIPSTTTFFKRKIFDERNELDKKFKAAMDYEYFCKLANRGYIFYYIPEPLAYFRKTGENYGKIYQMQWETEILESRRRYTKLPLKKSKFFKHVCFTTSKFFLIKRLFLKFKTHGFKAILASKYKAKDLF
jgi:glycosyltransferase involved in cell wall biosynthesis